MASRLNAKCREMKNQIKSWIACRIEIGRVQRTPLIEKDAEGFGRE